MSRSTFIATLVFGAFLLVKDAAQLLFLADGNARASRGGGLYPKGWRFD